MQHQSGSSSYFVRCSDLSSIVTDEHTQAISPMIQSSQDIVDTVEAATHASSEVATCSKNHSASIGQRP